MINVGEDAIVLPTPSLLQFQDLLVVLPVQVSLTG